MFSKLAFVAFAASAAVALADDDDSKTGDYGTVIGIDLGTTYSVRNLLRS